MRHLFPLVTFFATIACTDSQKINNTPIDNTIQVHGCTNLDEKVLSFSFRDKKYTAQFQEEGYVYTRSFMSEKGLVIDSLVNSSVFSRHTDGKRDSLSLEIKNNYANSVNSVLYFFRIPCVLNDPAVIKKNIGKTTIQGEPYDIVQVTFNASGGGEDFEDQYMYWINEKTHFIDFLAYNYHVMEGGTRFRQAINRREVEGVTVQDYVNYAPEEKFPALRTLPQLFEKNQLKELSRIINENVEIR